jgi:hypothetical protein
MRPHAAPGQPGAIRDVWNPGQGPPSSGWRIPATVAGAVVSAALLLLTFNRWWVIGLGINAAIIDLALQRP